MGYLKHIDTPQVVIHKQILKENIKNMQKFADIQGLKLRPHIKTHKIPEIAKMQLDEGASGITVSKLGEAEIMIESGIEDVFIAYEIVGEQKIKRLAELAKKASMCVAVDSLKGAEQLNKMFKSAGMILDVMIEIDVGLKRCGLKPDDSVVELAKKINSMSNLNLKGIFTHAGQVYGEKSFEGVVKTGKKEGRLMKELAVKLENAGFKPMEISVGSTPTVKISGKFKKITEIRPGNYVFYDAIQMGLGVAKLNMCSLSVIASVISIPTDERAVIDAGSKTLALDKGAHGVSSVEGFGYIKGHEDLVIERLSEEHGIIKGKNLKSRLSISDKLEIIPNHACPVVNLTDRVVVINDKKIETRWDVAARGKNR